MVGAATNQVVTPEIEAAVESVLTAVQAQASHVKSLKVVEAMTQVVAGTNVFAKCKVNDSTEFAFLRIFLALPHVGADPALSALQLSKSATDELGYFEA